MKHIFVISFLFILYNNIIAQDIIYLRDGTEIEAKILEVGTSTISYKKYSNIEGPTYKIEKNKVFMILYENGDKDVFELKEQSPNNNKYTSNNDTYKNKENERKVFYFGFNFGGGLAKLRNSEFITKAGYKTGIDCYMDFGNNIGLLTGIEYIVYPISGTSNSGAYSQDSRYDGNINNLGIPILLTFNNKNIFFIETGFSINYLFDSELVSAIYQYDRIYNRDLYFAFELSANKGINLSNNASLSFGLCLHYGLSNMYNFDSSKSFFLYPKVAFLF
jgi:hypothetical protein